MLYNRDNKLRSLTICLTDFLVKKFMFDEMVVFYRTVNIIEGAENFDKK